MDYNNKKWTLLNGVFILIMLVNCAGAATLYVPDNYATIQAAINAASVGDTIEVHSGTYYEHVDVNKQLTLQGVDTGAGLPVVDGSGAGSAITLSADGCTLEGFVARNSPNAGIKVASSGNTISGNTATGNTDGIYLSSSSNSNTISGNTVTGTSYYGIYLYSSSGNTISGNNATGNSGIGIYLSSSSGNTISGNTATGNTQYDILLVSSSGNTISDNNATGNSWIGIYFYYSDSNTISSNTATGNTQYGIRLDSSNDNTLYLNTFDSGRSDGANHWNSTTKIDYEGNLRYIGNRWSDYTGRDCDGDGIGETPYSISGGSEKDYHPLTDNTGPRTHTVCASGCNFTTIQAAINAACPGDTIEVHSGTYYEHVNVNKTLTLQGVDTGAGLPVVDASGSGSAITLSADGCTLQGFVASNSGSANSAITVSSSGDTISGNTVTGSNQRCIYLSSSSGNTVSGNTVTGAIQHGIYLTSSSSNNISSNTANDNTGSGIYLSTSSNNNIVSNNTASNNQYGIRLYTSTGNNISGNTANDNEDGLRLASSPGNTIEGNTANSNSDRGIYLASSINNIIWHNTVSSNTNYGIHISLSSGNTIYLNTFENTNNALSKGGNHWNSTTPVTWGHNGHALTGLLGNMWSDYGGLDCDGDGIGDTPYNITGDSEKDYHPIGGSLPSPALEAEKIADRSEAAVGDTINYTIWVNNTGNVTLTGVRAEDNLTSTVWTVETLAPGQNYTNTTRYQVLLSDLPGPLVNELWANGTDPCGTEVNASAIETVEISYNCIEGYKLDRCKEPLEGWTIFVDKDGDGVLGNGEPSDITDSSGYWQICGLDAGCIVNVTEVPQVGWMPYEPLTGWQEVTVLPNNETDYINFTNQKLMCISGYKLNSSDVSGLEGWRIEVLNSTGQKVGNDTTDDTGFWEVCGLLAGVYDLNETLQDGWICVSRPPSVTLECHNVTNQNFTNLLVDASIHITKSADPASGSPGTNVTFNLTVTNNGNIPMQHVFVSDLLPEGMSYVSSSYGSTHSGRDIYWPDIGLMAPGANRSLELVAQIDGPVSGSRNLINCVDVAAKPEQGGNVTDNASATVQAQEAEISVTKSADPTFGSAGALINFTLTVTNNGSAQLSKVFVSDLLPSGLVYDSSAGGVSSGQYVNWTYVGPLSSSASRTLWIKARIDGTVSGTLSNQVNVTASPGHGSQVKCNATANVESRNICISGHVYQNSTVQGLADWTINVNNSTRQWIAVTNDTGCWQVCSLLPGRYTVCEQPQDGWTQVMPGGCHNVNLVNDSILDQDFYNLPECSLLLTKTADKSAIHRGEDITYTIDLSNPCDWGGFTNVTLWDILPKGVELVSVYPAPSSSSSSSSTNLTWDVGTLGSGQHFGATIVVRVPIVDINYDASQTVRGEGFVNVHNDYDTHQGPESITNCAYAKADLVETVSSCASTGIVDPGTKLQSRESGSGAYSSEELTQMRTENRSIRSVSNLSAVHQPTTFSLPQNRSIDYGTKWTDKSRGINTITGATMNEEYTFADKIDKDRSIELDENGSTMKTEVEFSGAGHIGVLKKESLDAHPRSKPVYEVGEDYLGSFKVFEMVDEYGHSVKSNKSVAGYGYVAVDKRVQGSQRTYESGTGSYQSDEIIDTPSSYIAKDISLVRGPTSYNYTPGFNVSQNMLWSEGMWSKSGYLAGGDIFKDSSNCGIPVTKTDSSSSAASYISERFSSLDYLKKETVASGLSEMNTNATFSGMAEFEAKSIGGNKTTKVDNEERYIGRYDISRKVLLTGVSRYDRPHITVQKVGNMTTGWFNKTNAKVAKYLITITNDGNVALAPINVRDIFPPGTEYIGSSLRPASLSRTDVNWTMVHLGIGSTIEIELELNVTDYAPDSVVNRVMVCAMNRDVCVSGAAYFAFESAGLPCCPTKVAMSKSAYLDATDPTMVHFTIEVSNNADRTLAATLTDMLPAGLSYLSASPEPGRHEGQFLEWIVPDLQPDGVVVIEYQARATRDGSYVNTVHLDATAVDGTGYDTADAAAQVLVRSSGVAPKTTRYGGWQPPNWNMTSPDEGITIELSPEEDLVE